MSERILGKDLGVFKAVSISLGRSKKENRDKVLSRFAVITLKDPGSIGSKKSTLVLFEDDLGTLLYEELEACRKLGADNNFVVDQHNGQVVDTLLLKERSKERKAQDEDGEDELGVDKLLRWEGGMTMPYVFPDGQRYANDANGARTLDKSGQPIIRDRIDDVFVQVKFAIIKEDGTMDYTFYSGMNPNTRGLRLMNTFFKVRYGEQAPAAAPAAQPTPEAAPAPAAAPTGPGF
jgi:hypothetical protein